MKNAFLTILFAGCLFAQNPQGPAGPAGPAGPTTITWNSLLAPGANLSLGMAGYTTTYTYGAATGSVDLNLWKDTTGNTGTGILGHFQAASGSVITPWRADVNGVGWQVDPITGNLESIGNTSTASYDMTSLNGGVVTVKVADSTSTYTYQIPTAPAQSGQFQTSDTTGIQAYKTIDLALNMGTVALTSTASGTFTFTPTVAVNLSRLEWSLATQAIGCTTSPVLTAASGGVNLSSTVGNALSTGYTDGTAAIPANSVVTLSTSTASSGCSTPPGIASVTLHYTIQ